MEFAVPITQGNLLFRPMSFDPNPVVEGHEHKFDHVTIIIEGPVLVEELDATAKQRVRAVNCQSGDFVLIKAGTFHRLTRLGERAWAICAYAHRTPQGDVVQERTGWEDAYV